MAEINLSNYTTSLAQASSNTFTDGNVFFDPVGGTLELSDSTDTATFVVTDTGSPLYTDGVTPTANPLDRLDGVKFEAIYAFENQERRVDETLRQYDRWTSGTFKFGGAYNFVNGRVPANDATRGLIRGSGWNELTGSAVNRIYFGVKGLGAIEPTSTPYYQLGQYQASTDYPKGGNIDEAILVYRDDNGDGTPDEDNRLTNLYLSVRTFGKNPDRIDTSVTLGIAELGGYSTGAALNESDHLTSGSYAIADVYGGAQIAPWTGMSLEKVNATFTETGFAGPDGTFSWRLNNTGNGSLFECVAYLDAIAIQDAVVTTGDALLNGKDYDTWYEYTPAGRIRPITGAGDGLGVFIDNLPVGDRTSVEFVDDSSTTCVYPVFTAVNVEIGQNAIDDTNAWFHVFLATGYNTAGATTYDDASTTQVKGDANTGQPFISGTQVQWSHDFTTDGSVDVVMLCEGDIAAQSAGVTQQKSTFTLADATVNQSCVPAVENNA